MSQFDGASTLHASTIRSDALILATIGEQLRVELSRPVYAGIDADAALLAPTLEKLYALRETPERPDAADLVLESLGHLIELGTLMHGVADEQRALRPVNSAPNLSEPGRGASATGPLDAFLVEARAKYEQLRDLQDDTAPVTAHVRDADAAPFGE